VVCGMLRVMLHVFLGSRHFSSIEIIVASGDSPESWHFLCRAENPARGSGRTPSQRMSVVSRPDLTTALKERLACAY